VNRKGDGRTDCRFGIGDSADLKGRRRATGHADWYGAPSRWRRCDIADSPCDEVATYECRIWVRSVALSNRRRPVDFRYAPFATEVVRRCNM